VDASWLLRWGTDQEKSSIELSKDTETKTFSQPPDPIPKYGSPALWHEISLGKLESGTFL